MRTGLVGLIFSFAIILPSLTLTGCLQQRGLQGFRGGATILANLGGMDEEDRSLRGIRYELRCERDGQLLDVVLASKQSADGVTFPADNLADGDLCAMDIKADIDAQQQLRWYGVDQQGNAASGLYYGSDRQPIVDKRLSLTLYKLYSITPKDAFSADVVVNIAQEAGQNLPTFQQSIALLRCGERTYPSVPASPGSSPTRRAYDFVDLSVAALAGVVCDKLFIFENNRPVYATRAPLTLPLSRAQMGATISLGELTVEPLYEGDFRSLRRSSYCAQLDVNVGRCIAIELPRAKNYWFAQVSGRRGGQQVTFMVTANAGLILDDEGRIKTVADMNQAISDSTGAFRFYGISAIEAIKSRPLSSQTIADLQPMSPSTMNGVVLEKIERVFVHGFQEVSETELNAQINTPWFALASVRQDGLSGRFLIAGGDRYMRSAKLPGGKFLTWDAFIADRDTFPQQYVTYALTDESILLSSCSASFDYFLDTLSELDSSGMSDSAQHPIVDGCVVNHPDQFDEAEITFQWFYWGWHEYGL